jgi:hypothetical protein
MSRNRTPANEPRSSSKRHRALPLVHPEKTMTMQTNRPRQYDSQTLGLRGLVRASLGAKRHVRPRRPRTGLAPHINRNKIDPLHIARHPGRSVAKITVQIVRATIRRCRRQFDGHCRSNVAALIRQIPSMFDVARLSPASSPSKDAAI